MGLEYLTDYIYHILKPDIGKYSIHVSIWESLTIKTSRKRKLNRQILNQQILGPVILETYPNVYIQIYSDTCTTLSISIYVSMSVFYIYFFLLCQPPGREQVICDKRTHQERTKW